MSYLGLAPPPYACEATVEELSLAIERGMSTISAPSLDSAALYAAIAEAERAFVCVDGAISPALIGDLYELEAVARHLERDSTNAERFVRSAVDGGDGVRTSVTARYAELGAYQEGARAVERPPRVALVAPTGVSVRIDGKMALTRPNDRPYALQLLDSDDGRVLWTGLLPAGASPNLDSLVLDQQLEVAVAKQHAVETELAALRALPQAVPCPSPETVVAASPSPLMVGLALGSTALATGLHLGAAVGYRNYLEAANPTDEEDRRRALVNGTQSVAIGVGAVAVALDLALIWRLVRDEGQDTSVAP